MTSKTYRPGLIVKEVEAGIEIVMTPEDELTTPVINEYDVVET